MRHGVARLAADRALRAEALAREPDPREGGERAIVIRPPGEGGGVLPRLDAYGPSRRPGDGGPAP